jgi:phosphoesterase RecJ-like protein
MSLKFDFLDKFIKITDQIPKFYDLIIYVDCASKKRVGIEFDNNIKIINFDHHKSNNNFATINIVKLHYSSTAEVIYKFFRKNKITISKQIAQCLYAGIYDDSLNFSATSCNKNTFKTANKLVKLGVSPSYVANNLNKRETLAKYRLLPKILNSLELHFEGSVATIYIKDKWLNQTGAKYTECEDAVNMILNIAIVDIALFFRKTQDGIRVSLRSKNDTDVSTIAKNFNGGGHKIRAGCTCDTHDIKEAKKMILDYLYIKYN